jgi:SNF2 family DNA or RNA helicase
MRVENRQIVDLDGNRVPANIFWKFSKSTGNTLGLTLLGYGRPVIRINASENRFSISLGLQTDVGLIFPEDDFVSSDYYIYGKYWIPLEANINQTLVEILSKNRVLAETAISLGKLYKVIAETRELGFAILDFEGWENLVPEIEKTSIELALPFYEYQKDGVSWLANLFNEEIGALLCDEMGLGKTAQAFGLISHAKNSGAERVLVVTPASLTINWSRELLKFVPGLEFYIHKGPNRRFNPNEFIEPEIVIVSYELLVRDYALFSKIEWDLVICDEAQALKNSESRRHICISQLNSLRKVLITGTPVENSLRDLWSLINIIRPGLLGDKRFFSALIDDDPNDARRLGKFAHPLILRRLVKDVAKDLPNLVSVEIALEPNEQFAHVYEQYRKDGLQMHGNLLPVLTKLTQICCYPKLVVPDYSDPHDVKIVRLLEILTTIKSYQDQKVIIFSTFTESIDLLKHVISTQLNPNFTAIIDGRSSAEKRMAIVDSFESVEGFAVLLIQPNAGGVGLNITAANHVIHFNRQWNPAVERQATARAHRRGQQRTVFEYKMFYLGTIEEYISDRLYDKNLLAEGATFDAVEEGSKKDIQKALAISPMFGR